MNCYIYTICTNVRFLLQVEINKLFWPLIDGYKYTNANKKYIRPPKSRKMILKVTIAILKEDYIF